MKDLELRLPDEVMENIPAGKTALLSHLSSYLDEAISRYEDRLRARVPGMLGQPLSRYEKTLLKDFLLDLTVGKMHASEQLAAEVATSIR